VNQTSGGPTPIMCHASIPHHRHVVGDPGFAWESGMTTKVMKHHMNAPNSTPTTIRPLGVLMARSTIETRYTTNV
jgi:hypothetical protein